jgi:AcrR family transcriptional regulator
VTTEDSILASAYTPALPAARETSIPIDAGCMVKVAQRSGVGAHRTRPRSIPGRSPLILSGAPREPTTSSDSREWVASLAAMAETHVRRTSYGANSPVVGERGARTRQAIIDAALGCFEAKGYPGTSVDDIADAAGISRAALYQYFESKEQLYIELMRRAGGDLLRLIRRLGSLGPTAEGYDNLHWWLGEWAWVQDKYRALYQQWPVVASPESPMRPLMADYVESYVSQLSARFEPTLSRDIDIDIDGVAMALPALLFRVNDYRQKGINRSLSDDEMLDGLAAFVQLALFPSTPSSVLGADPTPTGAARPTRTAVRTPRPGRRPGVPGRIQPDPERFGTKRVQQTVQRILEAGTETFAARGFHATSVETILQAAEVGRGTFYRYFDGKLALLEILAEDGAIRLVELVGRFPAAVLANDGSAPLRRWLEEYLAFHRKYRGVVRALTEGDPRDPGLDRLGQQTGAAVLFTFDDALAGIERDHPFDVRSGSLILLAMLERVPDYAQGTAYDLSDERIVEVLVGLIERGLLDRGTAHTPRHAVARRRGKSS